MSNATKLGVIVQVLCVVCGAVVIEYTCDEPGLWTAPPWDGLKFVACPACCFAPGTALLRRLRQLVLRGEG